jgi:hypothetical protein
MQHGAQGAQRVKLTLIQAAIETGKNRSTIFRAIKKGNISAEKTNNDGYLIDPAELFRVYPPKANIDDAQQCATDATQHHAQGELVGALREQIEILRDQVSREREQTDHWRKQATMLLTYQPATEPKVELEKVESILWKKLFGRGS